MNEQDLRKKQVAEAALSFVDDDEIIGVGTGSTVNFFIDALATIKHRIKGTVSSSEVSTERLQAHGIRVFELNKSGDLSVYVDGADECDQHKRLIKGGGGALTREKVVAAASRKFVCIVDESKMVDVLGNFPLPVEVIPMAQSYVGRELAKLGAQPALREGFTTDNGNIIIDVRNLSIVDPVTLENKINGMAGVVTVGLFANRGADVILVAGENGVRSIR